MTGRAVAVAVAGGWLRGLDGGSDSLKRDFEGLDLGLQMGHVSALHFDLVPLAQDFDLLLLDETALFFKLRADSLPTGHTAALLFSSGAGPVLGKGRSKNATPRVASGPPKNCPVLNSVE
jgi:hypothetical protein